MVRWVKTDNGQAYADAVNIPEPPTDVEVSVNKIFQLVCFASSFPSAPSYLLWLGF